MARARDQGPDFNSHFEMIDDLPEEEQEEFHRQFHDRYGYRPEHGGSGEDRSRRSRDAWPKRGRDQNNLEPRGATRPGEEAADRAFDAAMRERLRSTASRYATEAADKVKRLYGTDSAPRRDAFLERYPGSERIKTTGLF
jgi:hypothetical protein